MGYLLIGLGSVAVAVLLTYKVHKQGKQLENIDKRISRHGVPKYNKYNGKK